MNALLPEKTTTKLQIWKWWWSWSWWQWWDLLAHLHAFESTRSNAKEKYKVSCITVPYIRSDSLMYTACTYMLRYSCASYVQTATHCKAPRFIVYIVFFFLLLLIYWYIPLSLFLSLSLIFLRSFYLAMFNTSSRYYMHIHTYEVRRWHTIHTHTHTHIHAYTLSDTHSFIQ